MRDFIERKEIKMGQRKKTSKVVVLAEVWPQPDPRRSIMALQSFLPERKWTGLLAGKHSSWKMGPLLW